jgi:hypothetical protein
MWKVTRRLLGGWTSGLLRVLSQLPVWSGMNENALMMSTFVS